jgi:hypothetical protein
MFRNIFSPPVPLCQVEEVLMPYPVEHRHLRLSIDPRAIDNAAQFIRERNASIALITRAGEVQNSYRSSHGRRVGLRHSNTGRNAMNRRTVLGLMTTGFLCTGVVLNASIVWAQQSSVKKRRQSC